MVNMVGITNMLDQNGLMQQVGIKMLDKTMEMADTMNQSMVKMMENSVAPHLGGNIDLSL